MDIRPRLVGLAGSLALALAAGVASLEGEKRLPYRDIGGVWTVCHGDTHDVVPGQVLTHEECHLRLVAQLERHNRDLLACLPELGEAPDHVHAALLDLAYNAGTGAVCGSSIRAKIRARRYGAACATITEFRLANHATVDCSVRASGCYGVWKRRLWERALCEGRLTEAQIAGGYAGYLAAGP